jgi:hypothetical protein
MLNILSGAYHWLFNIPLKYAYIPFKVEIAEYTNTVFGSLLSHIK